MCSKDCPLARNFVLTTSGEKVWWKIYYFRDGGVVKSKILGYHHSVCAQRKTGLMGLNTLASFGPSILFLLQSSSQPPLPSLPHQPLENKGNLKSTLVKNWKSEFNLTWFNLCSIYCTSKGNYSYRAIH